MPENDILHSIGNVLVGIDEKLSLLVEAKKAANEQQISEIKDLFDQIARVVSARVTGDLPRAVEALEKKIEIFDTDIKESLKSFSDTLLIYENKLEERIKEETRLLRDQMMTRLDHHQNEQTERLENIVTGIGSLGEAVLKLNKSIEEFDKNSLVPALKRLEEIFTRQAEEQKTKGGFFGKFK